MVLAGAALSLTSALLGQRPDPSANDGTSLAVWAGVLIGFGAVIALIGFLALEEKYPRIAGSKGSKERIVRLTKSLTESLEEYRRDSS